MIIARRNFLIGGLSLLAVPAIVRVESLMKLPAPVRFPLLYDQFATVMTPSGILAGFRITGLDGRLKVGDTVSGIGGSGTIVSVVQRLHRPRF